MTVDISKIKTGDWIHVRLYTTDIGDKHAWFEGKTSTGYIVICKPDDVVSVEPRPLSPGDKLRDLIGNVWQCFGHLPDGQAILGTEEGGQWMACGCAPDEFANWERL